MNKLRSSAFKACYAPCVHAMDCDLAFAMRYTMNLNWLRRASAILAFSLALAMTACGGDDKDNGGGGNGGNNNNTFTPNNQEQWLGAT